MVTVSLKMIEVLVDWTSGGLWHNLLLEPGPPPRADKVLLTNTVWTSSDYLLAQGTGRAMDLGMRSWLPVVLSSLQSLFLLLLMDAYGDGSQRWVMLLLSFCGTQHCVSLSVWAHPNYSLTSRKPSNRVGWRFFGGDWFCFFFFFLESSAMEKCLICQSHSDF